METSELLQRVRKIEIKTRGLSNTLFAGEYHSMFKGRGMAFSEVREYQYGDAIRDIDWNVTARFNKPYVKVFEEERELTVMLVVDVSASHSIGTRGQIKRNCMTEIAAVLAFSALQNNDKVGLLLFSDTIETFIPPQKGRKHILRIIRELLERETTKTETNIPLALQYITNAIKRKCTAFILSDFIDSHPIIDALSIANRKHDIIAIRVYDAMEMSLPDVGLIRIHDVESQSQAWIQTSDATVRKIYAQNYTERVQYLQSVFVKSGVDYVHVQSDKDYVKPLLNLFKKR
ncbi:MAG TPA: DUF58 domain-containing protein [Bacteroidales bacterium]|jgi:uncharacterized protein (DUF58 family)|nr:DUF58 domain-containing protein [Bacteroidales bacterium]